MANVQKISLPETKPDSCRDCKLLGLVPKGASKPKYSKKSHLCIGVPKAMTEDMADKRASECTDPKHPFKRPCDEHWERWTSNPGRIIKINKTFYRDSRDEYLAKIYQTIDFGD